MINGFLDLRDFLMGLLESRARGSLADTPLYRYATTHRQYLVFKILLETVKAQDDNNRLGDFKRNLML